MAGGRRRYRLLLRLAAAGLLWERLWPRLWPAAALLGTFAALVLLDLLPALPGWLHLATLIGFGLALSALLVRAAAGTGRVGIRAAQRRLERDSRLPHRPLAALDDRLAAGAGDPAAQMLWQRHLERTAEASRRLAVRLPAPGVARIEPWGVRAAVLLLLTIGLAAGGDEAGSRVARAFAPGVDVAGRPPLVEVWINPPPYTGRPPVFLHTGEGIDGGISSRPPEIAADAPIEIPAGSTAVARVVDVADPPILVVDGERHRFAPIEGGDGGARAHTVEATITGGESLVVRSRTRDIARWPLAVHDDAPPRVAFTSPPTAAGNGLLQLGYEASDDYRVHEVTVVVRPPGAAGDDAGEVRQPMPLTAIGETAVSGARALDLSAHAWAGRPVAISFEARDGRDQIGTSAAIETVLPEREFGHPVARRVIGLRKRLFESDADTRARWPVADELEAIRAQPSHFGGDVVVSLALAVGRSRLIHDRSPAALPSVREILWATALRLEEGDVPMAEQALEDARQRLTEALRGEATAAQIERLIDALQQAMEAYLAAVAAELARRGELTPPDPATTDLLRSTDLGELLDLARRYARTGARDGARQLLAELQRLLEGVRAGLRMDDKRRDLMQAHELMNSLRKLARDQQQLLDRTFQNLRTPRTQRRPPGTRADGDVAAQQRLRGDLGEAMMRADGLLGRIPAPLGEADRAMMNAGRALQESRDGDALSDQTAAVDALNRAMDAVGQAVAERLGGVVGVFGGGIDGLDDGGGDFFGRTPGNAIGGFASGRMQIPDETEVRRAQAILEELRRRAGEHRRPPLELEYIERLLRQF
jgi:uncharacterized protein (TIGR02302 family)